MSENHDDTMSHEPAEQNSISTSIGKIEENAQITTNDTGWTEEEKERMEELGYDGLDIVRAWYS